jgi:hypothetical protein
MEGVTAGIGAETFEMYPETSTYPVARPTLILKTNLAFR